jgi:ABC-type uncharacterized transport system auxiliary subunit
MRGARLSTTLFALMLAGCIGRVPYTPTVRYAVEPDVSVTEREGTPRAVAVRSLQVALPYSRTKIVYRTEGYVLGDYEHVEWAEEPGAVVTRALIDGLIASGRFEDVGDALNVTSPDLLLVGELRRFDEVRTSDPWEACCEVRLVLREGLERNAVWAGTVAATVPLERNDVAALPAAMSEAVTAVVEEAVAEIAAR